MDPVRDFPQHVDFLRVSAKSVVHVNVPVHFKNEEAAPGIKRGGVLNIVRHDVELIVPANAIPEALEFDLTGLEIGDSVHISAIKLPKGVSAAIQDRDFTIATIAAPAGPKLLLKALKKKPRTANNRFPHFRGSEPCCSSQVLAIRAPNMRITGIISVSWRRMKYSAAIAFPTGRRSFRPRSPMA
jgi:hypothetical protein